MSGNNVDSSIAIIHQPGPLAPLSDWHEYVMQSHISVRQKLVVLTALRVAEHGPLEFNSKAVCDLIDAKYSIVNYYFESRDGMLAEAAHFVHELWVTNFLNSLAAEPVNAAAQLTNIAMTEIEFNTLWRGMALFAAYPIASPLVRSIFEERYAESAKKEQQFHLAVLTQLIIDGRAGKPSHITFGIDNIPVARLALHTDAFLAAATVAWTFHGLTVWVSGQHIPSMNLEDHSLSSLTTNLAIRSSIKRTIHQALSRSKD